MPSTSASQGSQGDPLVGWHLSWQAARGVCLFEDSTLYPRVRERLIDAHDRPGRALIAFLMLPTEIHVICSLATNDQPGRVARAIGNIVARWVRGAQTVRSPVFGGPFRAEPIRTVDGIRNDARMLAWRPVFKGLCRTPSHHAHSGLRVTLGLSPAEGFDARPLLALFGGAVVPARAALRAWLAKRPSATEARQWELARGLTLVSGSVGPQRFTAREVRGAAAAALIAGAGTVRIDGALRLLELWVQTRLGVRGRPDLHEASDGLAARARALVACLAVDLELCSAAAVARHFGRAKATLSEQMSACRRRPVDVQMLRISPGRVVEEALALGDGSAAGQQHAKGVKRGAGSESG
jgi:hypothetical protein